MNTSTQFHIKLDGLNLKDDQIKAIAADLDKVVSTHLAKLDFGGSKLTVARPDIRWPFPWMGLVIINQALIKQGSEKVATVNSPLDIQKTLEGLPQRKP
jgi:hypothetical protein